MGFARGTLTKLFVSLAIVTLSVLPLAADEPRDITSKLERIRARFEVPGLAAAAVSEGEIVAIGATGSRCVGGPDLVMLEDQWHVGSCTKSMTASVAAMLVEEKYFTWETTIAEIFPEWLPVMHEDWREVTLEQLLLHRAGAPHEPPKELWKQAQERKGTPTAQRLAFIKGILAHEPEDTPGSRWIYSDAGYAIAGAMMERVASDSWENLLCKRLFEPLGLKSAGFGEPAAPGEVNHPWGHRGQEPPFKPIPPGPGADNPPAIGPAATVHMSIRDFARYAAWHVAGDRGGESKLLTDESFQKLHSAPAGAHRYAMGWVPMKRKWAGGTALMHNGENEMFYAIMWLGPAQDTCFVATCNCDGPLAEEACDDAIAMLINNF